MAGQCSLYVWAGCTSSAISYTARYLAVPDWVPPTPISAYRCPLPRHDSCLILRYQAADSTTRGSWYEHPAYWLEDTDDRHPVMAHIFGWSRRSTVDGDQSSD